MANEIALITGGSRGIGRAVALRLAEDGFDIWLNYRSDHAAAEETAKGVRERGRNCLPLPFDTADEAACRVALETPLAEGIPFALINNAGFARDGIMAMMSKKDWSAVLDVHLHGFFHVTSLVLPHMLRRRKGRIVNMASTSGQSGVAGQVNYSAAKAGLIGATRSLAAEVGRRGVLVNAIAPGFIDTDMLKDLPLDKILPHIPLGRLGSVEEVAECAAFLCSERSRYITGQVIAVNGGIHM